MTGHRDDPSELERIYMIQTKPPFSGTTYYCKARNILGIVHLSNQPGDDAIMSR